MGSTFGCHCGILVDVHPGSPEESALVSQPPSSFTSGEQPIGKRQLAPTVRVNAVAPGVVETAFLKGGTGQREKHERIDPAQFAASVPLQRVAQPADIVGPLLFLIGPGSSYMTGQTLHVNGGIWS
ncbi:MAG TPA: SDR family oxidoreductase [Ottowia sp.]|nr:SDR family oxidoreductase [Ottowia sp.]